MKTPSTVALVALLLLPATGLAIDQNHNGISDVFEYFYFGLPISTEQTLLDPDGDGHSTAQEAAFGTDPFDPSAYLLPAPPTLAGGSAHVSFPSIPGIRYQPYIATDLSTPNPWTSHGPVLTGTGGLLTSAVPLPGGGQLFLRLAAVPPIDADLDGLNAYEEALLGTSDATAMTDGDDLTDLEEFLLIKQGILLDPAKTFTVPGIRDGEGDADGDGVSDLDELRAGTDPRNSLAFPPGHPSLDLDGDGLPDAWEIAHFGDITSQGGDDDPDGDGLTNRQERILGTNPTLFMTDGIRRDGLGDKDGDNIIDSWEFEDGTDPNDRTSFDLGKNFVVLRGFMEHKASWGLVPSPATQFSGVILRASAMGYEDAQPTTGSQTYGLINDVRAPLVHQGGGNYSISRSMRFRTGVTYRIELLNTTNNPQMPFVSGKYFWTSAGNADKLDQRYFTYEVDERQSYSPDDFGTPLSTDPTITPDPDPGNVHFSQKGSSQGSPDAVMYPTGSLALGRNIRVDRNMNGFLGTSDPKDLENPTLPRGLIVDVNNTLVNGSRRNADETLGDLEKNNNHPRYGDERRVEPLSIEFGYGGLRETTEAVLKLEPGAERLVRVFDSGTPPVAVLGGGDGKPTSYSITNMQKREAGSQNFWIEGLAAGEAIITLELTAAGGTEPYHREQLRVEVNVDREPVTVSDVPKFPARHRARAIKRESEIRAIQGAIYSTRPLLTWTPRAVRSGMTSSLWFGFEPTNGLQAWAQVGLQTKVAPGGVANKQGQSFIYCEVAADYFLFQTGPPPFTPGGTRYFKRETYPTNSPAIGRHDWQNMVGRIEYQANASNSFQDRIIVTIEPADRSFAPVELLEFIGDRGSGGEPDVDLSTIPFNEYQAGAEMTASVTRLPGTKTVPARFSYIQIRRGPRLAIGPWTEADFKQSDLEIRMADPNNEAGAETLHQTIDPLTGATSHHHYNIRLLTPYAIELWDRYNWTQPDARLW